MSIKLYLYGAIAFGIWYSLGWLRDKFIAGNDFNKGMMEHVVNFITWAIPVIGIRVVIPYILAYIGLAIYCVLFWPTTSEVAAIRVKIKKKILA